jgi:hypothetical protein
MSKTVSIIESKVICKQPARYIGRPTVGVFPDGEILVVFAGDRDAHACPFGRTWSAQARRPA